jgi:hypothetical protein
LILGLHPAFVVLLAVAGGALALGA